MGKGPILTPAKIRTVLEFAVIAEGGATALAKKAGVSETTLRDVRAALQAGMVPSDKILTAIGIEHEHVYRRVVQVIEQMPEQGKA